MTTDRKDRMRLRRPFTLAALVLALAAPVMAQTPFAPVARVNDGVVTQYELSQRVNFLTVLRAPPEVRADALERLIEEQLQMQAAERVGATVSEAEIEAGMEEFAGRANLSVEEFQQIIGENGVAPDSFRNFVKAGLAWRNAVRARFGAQAEIGDAAIEKELATIRQGDGQRVLLSEIVLPTPSPAALETARERIAELRKIRDFAAFAEAAREFSSAPSAGRGGRIDWVELRNLPPELAAPIAALQPGEVTDSVRVGNTLSVYQLRARETTSRDDAATTIAYAEYLLPGASQSDAARIAARIDTCDDLYGVAKGQASSRLERHEAKVTALPAAVAAQIARLDPGEISTDLVRGDTRVLLMLCERGASDALGIARNAVATRLRGEQLTANAAAWLAELRADAIIDRTP